MSNRARQNSRQLIRQRVHRGAGAALLLSASIFLSSLSPAPALARDILDRDGVSSRDKAMVIREKLRAKRQMRRAGKSLNRGATVGQCGVNIGNQFTDGRGRASRKTNITVVIDKPVINLGNCK